MAILVQEGQVENRQEGVHKLECEVLGDDAVILVLDGLVVLPADDEANHVKSKVFPQRQILQDDQGEVRGEASGGAAGLQEALGDGPVHAPAPQD